MLPRRLWNKFCLEEEPINTITYHKINGLNMYNRLITKQDIPVFRSILETEKWIEKGFNSSVWQSDFGLAKWVSIFEEFRSIGKNNLKVVDLGSASSVVPHVIASWGNDVTGIDLMSIDHWCPKGLVKMVLGDALYELKQMENESVDVVIDSCSVHCFNPTWGDGIENWGWKSVADEVYRVLKPDGKLLISSDVSLSSDPGEFISPENMIKIVETSGLKLTSQYKKEYEYPHNNAIHQYNECYEKDLYISTLSFVKESNYYIPFYNMLFSSLRYKEINFGEIGIYKNSSMKMWREYFPKANLYGWDSNLNFINNAKEDNIPNSSYDYIDVTNEKLLCESFEKCDRRFDILIDDSDHNFWSRIRIIRNSQKYLNPGGLLVLKGSFTDDIEAYLREIRAYGHDNFYNSIVKINTHSAMGNRVSSDGWVLILTRNDS